MTVASRVGAVLPAPVSRRLRPVWHRVQLYGRYFANGGRLWFDSDLLTVIGSKPVPRLGRDCRMRVAVRSPRELRRWMSFGLEADDPTFDWLCALKRDDCLWSVGASNGLEGILASTVSGCDVVFVEPFTPSIESLLKSLALNARHQDPDKPDATHEVVQAAVDNSPGYARFVCHTKPVAGETLNSAEAGVDSYCMGGRGDRPVTSTQWTKFVTLDELHFDCDLRAPTHLMIDVDGFEARTLDGARRLLELPGLEEVIVEVNDDNGPKVDKALEEAGFSRQREHVHYQSETGFTADCFYRRSK